MDATSAPASAAAPVGVSVSVRVRPLNEKEGHRVAWQPLPGTTGVIAQLDENADPIAKGTFQFGA